MRIGLSIIAGVILAFAIWFGWDAAQLPESLTPGEPGPARIPLIAAGLITLLAVLLFGQAVREGKKNTVAFPQLPRVAAMGAAGIAYAALIPFIGYYAATIVFLLPVLLMLRASWRTALGVTVGFAIFIFLVFDKLLRVPLP